MIAAAASVGKVLIKNRLHKSYCLLKKPACCWNCGSTETGTYSLAAGVHVLTLHFKRVLDNISTRSLTGRYYQSTIAEWQKPMT